MENMVGLMILAPILIFTHLFMVYVQLISGKNYFYGVYVKNVNLNEDDKKRIDKEYKRRMNYTLIIIIILSILLIKTVGSETIIIPIALTIYIGLVIGI
ncbi:putative membrane protein [[Clostridium] sordellii ATCC 9714]|nr:putative membrane protein [[Clostridium] sordellii ATCC 9714] [Paeniclostridium sordellii ATCC 9714]